MINSILFDGDGVLFDSIEPYLKAFKKVLEKRGIRPSDYDISSKFGQNSEEILSNFTKDYKQASSEFRQEVSEIENRISLNQFVLETLQKMKNYNLALVSGSYKEKLDNIVKKFSIKDYFKIIISGDDVDKRKPNPEPLIKAIKEMNTTPEKTIFIGDSPFDIKASKSAGIQCVIVLTGVLDRKKAEKLSPDYIIKNLSELPKLIKNM